MPVSGTKSPHSQLGELLRVCISGAAHAPSQLAELDLKPDDIRYVGLSHLHADHSGNAALFPNATVIQHRSATPSQSGASH
jgi:glyoxylase-like metal-dependent hydrolase (beta-lactamase superfamily II)